MKKQFPSNNAGANRFIGTDIDDGYLQVARDRIAEEESLLL